MQQNENEKQLKNSGNTFDAIVVGAGHAGCEAALALARCNNKTLMVTLNLDAIGFLPCNPSIGGTAKGHLVCEIDALGGEMGKVTDKCTIQRKMLNASKGPAVHSLRAQVDKQMYHNIMKQTLENQTNLSIKQAEVENILVEDNKIVGITTCQGETFFAKAIVVCSGVYLKSKIITGDYEKASGPNGFLRSEKLSDNLKKLNLDIKTFKTGTPARLKGNTIDFSKLQVQNGEDNIQNFSFVTDTKIENKSVCYLTYTNQKTHEVIRENLHRAPMYSGSIKGIGPRYCPSIEDKVVRFADKEKHQIFLEPEGLYTSEIYVQGVSTSMPVDVQKLIYNSIEGLENAEIMRDAYAIEYDLIESLQLKNTLESKIVDGLFFAGQVNGTSGYEEAGAQGIIAGINANAYLKQTKPLILKRNEAYIGVLIDDLVTKGTNEPYRMMTSRAEYRLVLRQDNADARLTPFGIEVGLVDEDRKKRFLKKQQDLQEMRELLNTKIKVDETLEMLCNEKGESVPSTTTTVNKLLKRVNISIYDIDKYYNIFENYSNECKNYLNTEVKFEGYIKQEQEDIEKFKKQEDMGIPKDFNYNKLKGLKVESIQKLNKIKPISIGQASRISGVSPADITILIMQIKTK